MKEQTISRIAVILLGIILAIFGIFHFMHPYDLMAAVPNFLPGGVIWVYFVGVAFILAALAFITHKYVKLAGYLLALLLLIFVLTVHLPNFLNSGDKDVKQGELINVLKDTAIAAFALFIAANTKKIDAVEEV